MIGVLHREQLLCMTYIDVFPHYIILYEFIWVVRRFVFNFVVSITREQLPGHVYTYRYTGTFVQYVALLDFLPFVFSAIN